MSASRGIAVAVVASVIAACTSSSSATSPASGRDAIVGCADAGEVFAPNLATTGTNGIYTFTLVSAAPAPPSLNTNAWTIAVTSTSNAAPEAADLMVKPFMPLMGHGSDQVPQVTANADGTYDVSDIFLMMNGLWSITIDVMKDGTVVDEAVFEFCIDG